MIDNFKNNLKEILAPCDRPFVCNGAPTQCEVFIVGINAATEMEKSFWDFWTTYGFDKQKWMEEYILERKRKPLKAGKTRRNKLSNTRQRIEWISEKIKPIKTLETNLYAKATPTANELSSKDKEESRIFDFLYKSIKPLFLLIHGAEVKDNIEQLYGITLERNKVNDVEILGIKTKIYPITHLSRGWSKVNAEELGEKIKDILNK